LSALRRTPLYQIHVRLGARIVEFAGYQMPVQYDSIKAEHAAVRERVGLFDVSHMGQIHFSGPQAVASLERLVTCPVASLQPGRVRYGCLCNEDGGVVDDVTVYRISEDELFLCVNAANIEKDHRWILEHAPESAGVENRSDATALLALQGPTAAPLLASLVDADLSRLRRFQFLLAKLAGHETTISRTGYTGSDGFELYLAAPAAEEVWRALHEAGERFGLTPAGLGARDTLRLEAALPLYGHELDETTSPLEARLDRFVKLDAGGFIGAQAIRRRLQRGHERLLAGFILEGRGVARAGHAIARDGKEIGIVTSGAPSPTLGKSIGLGYVPPALTAIGSRLDVMVRGRTIEASVTQPPLVRAGKGSRSAD
jgi:aminomethyltransferase